ncbi:MAG: LysM peptidoglycan-binding domain-containing protein [Anaerolineales bacterium]|nr:LysM peptidoglycan-binding domain-containing protein [Anaerolineales bacterium]
MTKKVTIKVFGLSMLILLAASPAAVLAQDEESMAGEAMMAAVSCQQDYTVQSDDWLSKIAEKFYGDVLAYPAIAQATNAHYEAAMMAGDQAMAGEAMMAEGDQAMAEKEAMAGEAMMAESKLMLEGPDGQMMEAMMETDGRLLVKGADGQMMEVKAGEDGKLMAANGSMVDGNLMLAGADGQMMEVTLGDQAMTGDETMMASSYALIENPDIIEPGWVLCIPNAEDAQKLLSETAAMTQ